MRRRLKPQPFITAKCGFCSWVRNIARTQDEGVLGRLATARKEHETTTHPFHVLALRLADIEREAKWEQDSRLAQGEPFTEEDWATHPLAVEYRALLRQWWTGGPVPLAALTLSPSRDRLLTLRGTGPRTAGDKLFTEVARHQRQLREQGGVQ